MQSNQLISGLAFLVISGLFCSQEPNTPEDPIDAIPSTTDISSDLFVSVYPQVITRQEPSVRSQPLMKLPLDTRLTVDSTRSIPKKLDTLLGTQGYWIPIKLADYSYERPAGWIFSPLVQPVGSSECSEAQNGDLQPVSCYELINDKGLNCARFNSDSFPENFNGGCMNVHPLRLHEEVSPPTNCGLGALTLLSADGKVRRNFQQHAGFNGEWKKESSHIVINVGFWSEGCIESCLYSQTLAECETECKDVPPPEVPDPVTFELHVDESGFPFLRDTKGNTRKVCIRENLPYP